MSRYTNVVIEEFRSITHLLHELDTRPTNNIWGSGHRSSQKRTYGSDEFYGTSTYDDAKTLATKGWDEHLGEIKKRLNEFTVKTATTTPTERVRPVNHVVGFAPHVPNAILGLPQSMITTHKTPQKQKAMTIIYNTSVLSDVSVQEVLDCGITVLQLVNAIELSGVRVKLVSEFKSSQKDGELGIARVVVKEHKDHLDLKKIAFPFAHAAMQRRLGFAWNETVQGLKQSGWYGSYGGSIANTLTYDEIISELKEHNALKDDEVYITTTTCKECHYDVKKLAKQLDIKF